MASLDLDALRRSRGIDLAMWPPRYDPDYRPDPTEPHWLPELECAEPAARDEIIFAKLGRQLRHAWERSPFYRRKWQEAGVSPETLKSLDDLARFPVVQKAELREAQATHPPFGDYLCVEPAEVARIHGTSGTTGRPTVFGIGAGDWERIGEAHARIMWGAGLRPDDRILICSFFSLYMGSWGVLKGGERLGAALFPFGAGVPGQTLMAVQWARELRPTAFYGTPSYALHFAETTRREGIDPRTLGFRTLFFSGEPGAGIAATKRLIEETFGGICIDMGSMAEMTPWMTDAECRHRMGMHLWQDLVYTQVCDPETFRPVPSGSEGTPVYTHLERTSQPMIRLVSGDRTRWVDDPCPCGRTYPRLPHGIYGRFDDMLIVRGENVYPSAIEDTLRAIEGFGGEFRVIVSRREAMDELLVRAEHAAGVADPRALDTLRRTMAARLRARLGVHPVIELVPEGTLPRTEFKARRVIDDRDLYRQALAREHGERKHAHVGGAPSPWPSPPSGARGSEGSLCLGRERAGVRERRDVTRYPAREGATMFDPRAIERITAARAEWEARELQGFLARQPEARGEYRTASGLPVKRVYTAEDIAATPFEAIGLPGQYPFTRGPYPTMYRGRPWTMRQIAGFGTGEDTNRRFRYLIEQGQTGLSVDFDMPTLMGYDSDDPHSLGEVGREGVAIDTLDDMEALFEGIDLERISVSMTINPTAWILLAMYVALAESRGNDLDALSGTVQADILKEYIAQKEWTFPIRPSMRIMRDMIVFCASRMARYNPINISGYHISEAGATSVQELAFTMANAIAYVEEVMRAGVPVDAFAPRLAFYFVAQADFFEEIAKFRAARRIYARLMKERFGATRPESMRLRFHCQTAAATLTKAQPLNNIVRTAFQALAAVLGGAQSLHTNGLDEAYAIPSEEAMKVALRTQQIIAHETRVPDVVDPLGGSYYVEALTSQIEAEVFRVLEKVDAMGGPIRAIETGYFQREIADAAYEFARRKASGEQPVIGVNLYAEPAEPAPIPLHTVDPAVEARQVERLRETRRRRDPGRVAVLLERLAREARDPSANLMPVTIELARARATLGEIVSRLRGVFGAYNERPVF